jgi:branched-chain amino acid transport system substrate-binding protein
VLGQFREAMKGGLKIGNGTRPIEVSVRDSQSNPNRAAEVAKELIVRDKVDLMLVASTPETTNPRVHPVRDRGGGLRLDQGAVAAVVHRPAGQSRRRPAGLEALQLRLPLLLGPGGRDRRLHQHVEPGRDQQVGRGAVPNDGDGNAWGDKQVGFPPVLDKQGYKLVDPGRYQNLTDNFSAQITAFKNAQCQIVTGVVLPPDFTTFWKQALQQGFKPKAASVGKAILFPVAVEALGKDGHNLSSEVWWSPSHPFKSSLTGQSAKQLADAYEAATKKQWTQPIGFIHSLFEVATDVLKRSKEVGNAKATVEAIAATNLDTVVGKVAWNGKGVPPFAAKNVTKTPLVGGQWRIKDGNKYDIRHHRQPHRTGDSGGGKMEAIT